MKEIDNVIEGPKFEGGKSFANQVDAVLSGADTTSTHLKVMGTPLILRQLGAKNIPVLMTAKHLKSIVAESGGDKSVNYHGIDSDLVKKLPELLSDPVIVMDSLTRDDSVVVVTSAADKENRPVIGAIKFDGFGNINNIEIAANILMSTYGKDNFESFIRRNIEADNVLYWDREKSQELIKTPGFQLPDNLNHLDCNTIIRKAKAFVNSTGEKNVNKTIKEFHNTEKSIADTVEQIGQVEQAEGEKGFNVFQDRYGNQFSINEVQMMLEGKKPVLTEFIDKKASDWEIEEVQQADKADVAEQVRQAEVDEQAQIYSQMRADAQKESDMIAETRIKAMHLAKETGEPYVTINWSEYSSINPDGVRLNNGDIFPLSEADKILEKLNADFIKGEGYAKTKLDIDFVFEGNLNSWEGCRFDIGTESGGLIAHIADFADNTPKNYFTSEENKLINAIPHYLSEHIRLSNMLIKIKERVTAEDEIHKIETKISENRKELNAAIPYSAYQSSLINEQGKGFYTLEKNGTEKWFDCDKCGSLGKLVRLKDGDGYEREYEYDERGKCVHTKDCNNYETWCEYDKSGKLKGIKDSNGDVYDSSGMKISPQKAGKSKAETPAQRGK